MLQKNIPRNHESQGISMMMSHYLGSAVRSGSGASGVLAIKAITPPSADRGKPPKDDLALKEVKALETFPNFSVHVSPIRLASGPK